MKEDQRFKRGTKLHHLKQLAIAYSGNDDPYVFVLTDEHDDSSQAIQPTCVFIDDDGDIIIQVNKELL